MTTATSSRTAPVSSPATSICSPAGPVIVTGVARGRTRLMRVPDARLREMLNKMPQLSEKLLIAIQERRRLLSRAGSSD